MARYIDADALYEKIVDMPVEGGLYHIGRVVALIDNATAADVAPVVHGEWVYTHHASSMACVTGHVRCVSCNRIRPRLIGDILNFCPNCGADMRERKGDDA